MNSTKSRTYQGLIGMCLGTVVLPALGVPECHVACAMTVNVNPEAMCDDFQVFHTPVVGIPPHSREDFLGVGHDSMVPNTAPVNNTGWLTGARDGSARIRGEP